MNNQDPAPVPKYVSDFADFLIRKENPAIILGRRSGKSWAAQIANSKPAKPPLDLDCIWVDELATPEQVAAIEARGVAPRGPIPKLSELDTFKPTQPNP